VQNVQIVYDKIIIVSTSLVPQRMSNSSSAPFDSSKRKGALLRMGSTDSLMKVTDETRYQEALNIIAEREEDIRMAAGKQSIYPIDLSVLISWPLTEIGKTLLEKNAQLQEEMMELKNKVGSLEVSKVF